MKNFILLSLALLFFSHIYSQNNFTVDAGDQAYDFIGINEHGEEIKLSDYNGKKYILLNFTATYCGPCWGTYNQMNKVQEKYKNELKVISFHWDDAKEQWNKMAKRANIDFKCTSIWDAKNKDEISKIYQIDGWPYFFLIDKKGTIVEKWFGNNEKRLDRKLIKYL
ncbi:TlpA family protein disulfide reductase [Confluentibacter citreus]|uniref:TlpA family protein disulfide reductase n=1 Tax=Confluentibacter citreus TaxID=2007307 RepID=UPI000C28245A|nr:TlpA disulfide reductase family protein [Confluentibacter citreus]